MQSWFAGAAGALQMPIRAMSRVRWSTAVVRAFSIAVTCAGGIAAVPGRETAQPCGWPFTLSRERLDDAPNVFCHVL